MARIPLCSWLGHALEILDEGGWLNRDYFAAKGPLEEGRRNWDSVSEADRMKTVALYTVLYGQWHYFSLRAFLGLLGGQSAYSDSDRPVIIDLGCGPGTATVAAMDSRLFQGPLSSHGFDGSEAMCAFARQALTPLLPGAVRVEQMIFGEGGTEAALAVERILGGCDNLEGARACLTVSFLISQKDATGRTLSASAAFKNMLTRLLRGLFERGVSSVDLIGQNGIGIEPQVSNQEFDDVLAGIVGDIGLNQVKADLTWYDVPYRVLDWDNFRALAGKVSLEELLEQLYIEERLRLRETWLAKAFRSSVTRVPSFTEDVPL